MEEGEEAVKDWDRTRFVDGKNSNRTPNLDALSEESVVLDKYYVTPMCSPSRAALMTGRYPFRYGLQDWVIAPDDRYGLNLNETLLPQVLKDAGYETRMVGKWHIGQYCWESTPTFRGFDSFFGYYGGAEDYYTHRCTKQREHKREAGLAGVGSLGLLSVPCITDASSVVYLVQQPMQHYCRGTRHLQHVSTCAR